MLTEEALRLKKHIRQMWQREKSRKIARGGPRHSSYTDHELGIRVVAPPPPPPNPKHIAKPSLISRITGFFKRRGR